MTAGETELEMAVRHVAEQVRRIANQEVLIERLRTVGAPSDDASALLDSMQNFLKTMRAHVARLSS
jgi:ATP-dependent protease HslVU (ClpYQ) peptidase subunit